MRKIFTFALLCALLTGLAGPVRAYSDLPAGHWAYADMNRAAEQRILTGYEDGGMHPEENLTWGQSLTMLARTFYPDTLAVQTPPANAHWAAAAYLAALEVDVLEPVEFLPVSVYTLDSPAARQDMAVLLDRVARRVFGADPVAPSLAGFSVSDWNALPEPYRPSVLQCYLRGLINGYEDGRFGGGDPMDRATGATLMVRLLDRKGELTKPPSPPPVTLPPSGGDPAQPGLLTDLGSNDAKLLRLYGTTAMKRYPSKDEAQRRMTAVTVPVWRLDKNTGTKSPATCTFQVNAAIAGDMTAIFTEIYNDPEQFPIYSIGGYSWRGDAAKGEHNCGTAVDINYLENYQIYSNGSIGAGTHWTPGADPHSIPEDGSVVRAFRAHGYTWGGNAWPNSKDYMHFSYLGV